MFYITSIYKINALMNHAANQIFGEDVLMFLISISIRNPKLQ